MTPLDTNSVSGTPVTRLKLSHETGMGLRGHPVAQAYERLAAAIFETAYLSAARIGRRPFTSA